MLVAYGIMLALFVRERTGIGQKVETSLLAGALTLQATGFVQVKNDPTLPRSKPRHMQREVATYRAFETKDGYINVGALNNRTWKRLCEATGLAHLQGDPRFENQTRRFENNRLLNPLFEEVFKLKTRDEWVRVLDEAGVPCGPVNDLTDLFDDPHLVENELVAEIDHPTVGPIKMLGLPVKLSETPGKIRRPAPLLGQHTDEVMAELGLSPTEIADLRARAIIA